MRSLLAPALVSAAPPLTTVAHVDLARYLGTWYEIASFPAWFQRGCTATTATYSPLGKGDIRVINECRKGGLGGDLSIARGKAWVTDERTNAKLRVQFFWPFSGHYWVIGLDPNYGWAVVGEPRRKYLWILARSPQIDEQLYARLVHLARDKGYDTSKLVRTPQRAIRPPSGA